MQTLSASPQGPIDNIESVLRAVSADLAHVGVDLPPLSMLDRSTGQLVGCPNLDLPTSALEPPEPHEILVQFGEHWFRVAGGLTWPELTAAVASRLQDDVVDLLGRGWPELTVRGRFAGILEPSVSGPLAVWASASGFSCPVGTLFDSFGDAVRW